LQKPLTGAPANSRGQTILVTLDPSVVDGSTAQKLAVVEVPKQCGEDAEVIVVTLGMELPPNLVFSTNNYNSLDYQVNCLVEWGIGSVSYSAEIDWRKGMTFALTASWLRVTALIPSVPFFFGLAPIQIRLMASFAYGNFVSNRPICKTEVLGDAIGSDSIVAGGLSINQFPPMWAQSLTIMDGTITPPDYLVQFFNDFTNPSIFRGRVTTRPTWDTDLWLPIPKDARGYAVTNNRGVAATSVRVIYNLNF